MKLSKKDYLSICCVEHDASSYASQRYLRLFDSECPSDKIVSPRFSL